MKRTTVFELVLPQRNAEVSANRWLYQALRAEILEGRLRPGARLPATRDLARQYGLARGTIVNVFEQLRSEGYIEGSVGSGTYVNRILPDELLHVPREESTGPSAPPNGVEGFPIMQRGRNCFRILKTGLAVLFGLTCQHWTCSRRLYGRRLRLDACGASRRIFSSGVVRWDTHHCEMRSPAT